MYEKIAARLDEIADDLESKGFTREAEELDVVANTLEKTASNSEVKDAWETTKEVNPDYAKTLTGERPAGSKWGENLTEQKIVSLPWKKYTGAPIPGVMTPIADYFYLDNADKYFPNARQRMEMLSDAEKKGYQLHVRKGAHGSYEIVSPQVKPSGITQAWLIVGPASDAEGKDVSGRKMVWTLYPGKITGADRNWDGKLESIPEERKPYIAVKAPE